MREHVSNHWWCEHMSSWLHSRNFFTVAPRSLVGPHFPYIMMSIEGGNSTEATYGLASSSPIQKRPTHWSIVSADVCTCELSHFESKADNYLYFTQS